MLIALDEKRENIENGFKLLYLPVMAFVIDMFIK